MFATVVQVRIDIPADQALKHLHEEIVPRVKQAPGVQSAYWFAPVDGKGLSVVVWESKQQAEAAAAMLQPGSNPTQGVTVEQLELREVVASF